MTFRPPYVSPYLVTNQDRMCVELEERRSHADLAEPADRLAAALRPRDGDAHPAHARLDRLPTPGGGMMAGRVRECLKLLRWSEEDLADELGCPRTQVRSWIDGRQHPPLSVAAWLEALVKAHDAVPRPRLNRGIWQPDAVEPVEIRLARPPVPHPALRGPAIQTPRPRRTINMRVPDGRPTAGALVEGASHESYPL